MFLSIKILQVYRRVSAFTDNKKFDAGPYVLSKNSIEASYTSMTLTFERFMEESKTLVTEKDKINFRHEQKTFEIC